jgi:hypothetical protein
LSKKKPKFLPLTDGKLVLSDSKRPIEVHEQVGTAHSDAVVMVYLPVEKILVQVDAWNTGLPTSPNMDTTGGDFINPYIMNLYNNIVRLNLDVDMIVPLHGPRTGTMEELRRGLLLE